MSNSLSDIFYISVENLKAGFISGEWGFCRPEFYMRRGENRKSIEEKKVALTRILEDNSKTLMGEVEILEPLVAEKDPEGKLRLISGNTRVKALFELFEIKKLTIEADSKNPLDVTIAEDDFLDIPYRVFNEPITFEDAINFQTSTNDFTESHNPYEIAWSVSNAKKLLEEQEELSSLSPKKKAGAVSKRLQEMFRTSSVNIGYYLNVIEKGTDTLFGYIENKQISLDTAYRLIQNAEKYKQSVDDVLNLLIKDAVALATVTGENDGEQPLPVIFKKHVEAFFSQFQSETPENIVTPATPSVDGVTPVSSEVDDEKEIKNVSKLDFESFAPYYDMIYSLEVENFKEDTAVCAELFNGMVEAINKTTKYIKNDESVVKDLEIIKEIFLRRFEDLPTIVSNIPDSEVKELSNLSRVLGKITKPADRIRKIISGEVTTDETEVEPITDEAEATSEVITMETDDYIATAS